MKRINILLFFPAALLIFSGACTKIIIKSPTAEEVIFFPAPPDTARIQFLTYINTSADVTGPQSVFQKFFLGEEKPKPIVRPYGIEVTGKRIYICDPNIAGLEIIDLEDGSFEYFLPTGKGQLQSPLNCYIDDLHYLFVADGNRKQVVVFDHAGKYINAFGGRGNFKPTDVWVSNEKIWVANLGGNKILVYDRYDYSLIDSIGGRHPEDEDYLFKPTSISISDNKLFVVDFGEVNIKVFSLDGKLIETLSSYGRNMGQLNRPKGIAHDRDDNLYVVDAAFENVQIFNNKGQLLMYFGKPGNMNLPAGIAFDYNNLDFFRPFVYEGFELDFLIFVSNQYPPNKIGVYGFIKKKTIF